MARVFPASQRPLIRAVLNRLIPAGGGFPGAADLDLLDHLDGAACSSSAARRMFVEGMRQIGLESERRHGKGFEDLVAAEQDAVLRHVEAEHRAFFEALVSHVYQGYYSHPAVIQLLGLEARPPQPLGHSLPPFDAAVTGPMSKRRALYRQAEPP
jgi:gluconate 2-dehydrogenase subunit 3-like protein